MKKIIIAALMMPLSALAQTFPSPTFNSLTLQNPLTPANGGSGSTTSTGTGSVVLSNSPTLVTPSLGTPSAVTLSNGTGLPVSTGVSGLGTGVATGLANAATGSGGPVLATSPTITSPTITGGTITGLSGPLPIASGGTNASSASGTTLDNITGFSSTGFLTRTGAGAYAFQSLTNGITLGNLTQQAANTVLANATGSTANVAAFAMPSCSTSSSALQWTSGTGFTCYANSATTTGTLAQFASTTSAQLAGIVSDETGSGSLVFGTSPTIGTPTISGGTINSASVGATTPSTGSFTTLAASSSSVAFNFTSPGGQPTVGAVGNIATNATLGKVFDGSTGSPHTTLTPSVAITRNEAVNSASLSGNSPALWVETVSNNSGAGNPNGNAVEAIATQNGSGDAVGVTGWATQSGTGGHTAFGGFFNATATTSGSFGFAVETFTGNDSGANAPLNTAATPQFVGLHVGAGGNFNDTAALWVSAATGGGTSAWDSGLYFGAGSALTYSIIDVSNSAQAINIGGSHQFGLVLSSGSFSQNAIQATGFSVNGAGTVRHSISPTVGWSEDATGSTVTIANGGNAAMPAGNGLLIVEDSVNSGLAMYLCSGGNCALASSVGTAWVAPTTTPAAGKLSVMFSGSAYTIYNNSGSTETITVSSFRMKPSN